MPVLPLVGSTITVPGLIFPVALARFDHRHADAILHAAKRIEELALEQRRWPASPSVTWLSRTSGVRPTVSTMSL